MYIKPTQSRINVYHAAWINSEFLPNEFNSIGNRHLRKIQTNQLCPMKNLPTENESEYIYTNPNHSKSSEKFEFSYNTLININQEKISNYFKLDKYIEFFSLFQLYLEDLFNGLKQPKIKELFYNQKISDSVYIYAMKCFELIEKNKKNYTYTKEKNKDNYLDTTENSYNIKVTMNTSCKEDALLLLSKFQMLLGIADKVIFAEDITMLKDLYSELSRYKS